MSDKKKLIFELTYGSNMITGTGGKDWVISHSIGHVLRYLQENVNKLHIVKVEEIGEASDIMDITEARDE